MKTSKTFTLWAALALACTFPGTVRAQIFVANYNVIGEYAFDGSPINASLITGLNSADGLAILGGDIFVANQGGTVGEYTTAGATVNSSLVSGLGEPYGLTVIPSLSNIGDSDLYVADYSAGSVNEYTVSGGVVIGQHTVISGLNTPTSVAITGGDIFVANQIPGTISEYTLAGAPVNTALIAGLNNPFDLAISGGDIFVSNAGTYTIGEYTTSGGTVNASLVSVSPNSSPEGFAISGNYIFVGVYPGFNGSPPHVGEYTTSGGTVNASLISGLNNAAGIAVLGTPAPEPSTDDLTALSITALFGLRRRK